MKTVLQKPIPPPNKEKWHLRVTLTKDGSPLVLQKVQRMIGSWLRPDQYVRTRVTKGTHLYCILKIDLVIDRSIFKTVCDEVYGDAQVQREEISCQDH